ncbi:MAG: ferredoxin [Litoreibacter sp.]|uniref:ferredoxin n=1 Tax=Litoreibacter sp. TaxID=1969459 RepID=UPI0032976E0E
MVTLARLEELCDAQHLSILGAFHPKPDDLAPKDCRTVVLLGPREPGFWATFTDSPEWRDKTPDPMDRWSTRVISSLALETNSTALFPFGGPPYQPFFRWALASGQAWQSPVSLLVHKDAGLMVSYRGALALSEHMELPPISAKPCGSCATQPCLTACPSGALGSAGYDVPTCHAFLDTEAGQTQLMSGCNVRRACPLSQSYGRMEEQSAYHMSIFHKGAAT